MGRPTLDIGTHGDIRTYPLTPEGATPEKWRACTLYRGADGVTRQIERRGPTEAKAKAAVRRACRDHAEHATQPGKQVKLADIAPLWLKHIERKKTDSTHERYKITLRSMILPRIGQLQVTEISPGRLDDWQDELETAGYAPNTRRFAKAVVTGILQFAVRKSILSSNPARHMSRIEGGARKKPRAFDPDELVRFLDELHADQIAEKYGLKTILLFLLGTGLRIGEALGMRWCDVTVGATPAESEIRVTGNVVYVDGKGLVRHEGKTFKAARTLSMPEFVHMLLTVHRPSDAAAEEPLFPSSSLSWRSPNTVQTGIRRLRHRIGFEWMTSHVFRKTVATELDRAGHSARQIADHLGHAQISTTQNTYLGRGQANPEAAGVLDSVHRRRPVQTGNAQR